METIQPPFPWFGGKSRVAPIVWERFGAVGNYVEPFFGSGAVLFGRPDVLGTETVNDLDGYVANFWRAVQGDPEAVAKYADNPANENDLHARHLWLVNAGRKRVARLEGEPDYYDAQTAGWWVWGMAQWIGGGFCAGNGKWVKENGMIKARESNAGQGVQRRRLHLGNTGNGVQRRRLHLGDTGQGVQRQLLHLGNTGQGIDGQCERSSIALFEYMKTIADRMRLVRVCCGDWSRICGPTPTYLRGLTGVFLDPPYSAEADRDMDIYATDSGTVAHDVREWAIANGDNPLMRIALCGYDGEHTMPQAWECVPWKAAGGYSKLGKGTRGQENAHRERIWFSPHCLRPESGGDNDNLFSDAWEGDE